MNWLFIPSSVVSVLASSASARGAVAKIISEPSESPEAFEYSAGSAAMGIGRIARIDAETAIIALWPETSVQAANEIVVDGHPLLALWCNSAASTVAALDPPEITLVLERAAVLAIRHWTKQPYPQDWYYSNVDNLHSIFATPRTKKDLRFAFSNVVCGNSSVLRIGSLWTAYKQASALLPELPSISLPLVLEFPSQVHPLHNQEPQDEHDGRDLRISSADDPFHLFSLSFERWTASDGPLTREQRRVVNGAVNKPVRIHGPAGSGKTLVLILKAIKLLREAQDSNSVCHILFVVTSNAVALTIRAAIEAIDDRVFLATSRSDSQYLKVDTLHGWCMEELDMIDPSKYVLERDPKESKRRQAEILREVFDQVVTQRFERSRSLFSKAFVDLIDNHPTTFLQELQREISIRIKGRGFRPSDRDKYVANPTKTFVGTGANIWDKHLIFHFFVEYEARFKEHGLLDTDDVVISMCSRLSTPLWDRQRRELGFDYIMVDEAHLFNENERRVLPLLSRGALDSTIQLSPTCDYPRLVMTFDEAQSIGGSRGLDLASAGILDSQRRNLHAVHRCSPDIFALSRDLVERSPLTFTEFLTDKNVSRMSEKELVRCRKPFLINAADIVQSSASLALKLKTEGYRRVGLIIFDRAAYDPIRHHLASKSGELFEIEQRGEKLAAVPRPGFYMMSPEACGGLEFDAVVLVGVDEGTVPALPPDINREAYQSILEEAYMEVYTAVTRAKYVLAFVCDDNRGISPVIQAASSSGLISSD